MNQHMDELWCVDNGLYRKAYYHSLQTANQELPPHILAKISVPQAIALPARFEQQQQVRLLVMGQETQGNYCGLKGCDHYEAWSRQIGGYIAFDYADGGGANQREGKFWRAIDEIREALGLPSKKAIAWSNIVKVQLLNEINGSYSISKLSAEEKMVLVRWQRKLFDAEMAFAQPNAILFLTGGLHWVADHMFDGHRCLPMNTFNIVKIENLNIPMVQTFHPNARNGSLVDQARADALVYLKAQLGFL